MSSLFGVCFADIYWAVGLIIACPAHHVKFGPFERWYPAGRPSWRCGRRYDFQRSIASDDALDRASSPGDGHRPDAAGCHPCAVRRYYGPAGAERASAMTKSACTQAQGEAKKRWDRLTDDDVLELDGRREVLIGKLQVRYCISHRDAERQVGDSRPGVPSWATPERALMLEGANVS